MPHHRAYNLTTEDLDVVIVEDSKPMQTVLRSVLMPLRLNRTRVFDSADDALQAMFNEPPDLVITDWRMRPTSGYQMLKAMRHKRMEPLCYAPVIFVTAHATRPLVEKAIRGGAHHLLAKPVSPARLHECIHWVTNDAREFVADEQGYIHIAGVTETLVAKKERMNRMHRARAYHEHMERRSADLQTQVDALMVAEAPKPKPAPKPEPKPEPVRIKKIAEPPKPRSANHDFAAIRPRFA